MSPVPNARAAIRVGSGSAVTATMCGVCPFLLRKTFSASVRVFCALSLRIVHLVVAGDATTRFYPPCSRTGVPQCRERSFYEPLDYLLRGQPQCNWCLRHTLDEFLTNTHAARGVSIGPARYAVFVHVQKLFASLHQTLVPEARNVVHFTSPTTYSSCIRSSIPVRSRPWRPTGIIRRSR